MLSRGEFAKRVLQRISEACDAEHWPENSLPAETADVSVFVRYESEWAFGALWHSLQDALQDDTEVSEDSLADFIGMMRNRWEIIADTDCVPNHTPNTLASKAYYILASEVSQMLSHDEDNNPDTYHCLFPDLAEKAYTYRAFSDEYIQHLLNPEADYQAVTLYEGNKFEVRSIEELSMGEFIWSDPHKPSIKDKSDTVAPIVLLSSIDALLEKIRRGSKTEVFPLHTSLSVIDSNNVSAVLFQAETSRIFLHSDEANSYLNAVRTLVATKENQKSLAEIAQIRAQFIQTLKSQKVIPVSRYISSDSALLAKGWLSGAAQVITAKHSEARGNALPIYQFQNQYLDIWVLADFLNMRIRQSDWREFVKCLAETDDYLGQMAVPTKGQKQDLSLFDNATNFSNFVNTCFGLNDQSQSFSKYCSGNASSSSYATALLFILTELYSRQRAGEPGFTGFFSQATDGQIGSSRTEKTNACRVFQDFLIDPGYMLDQFTRYCSDKGKENSYKVFNTGRTKLLLDMAIVHGPGLDKKMQTLRSTSETLLVEGGWKEQLSGAKKNTLLAIAAPSNPNVGESEAFREIVSNYKNYAHDNEALNRAVLFVLSEIYLLKRSQEGSNRSVLGGLLAFGKSAKVKAVEAFQVFLLDKSGNYGLNEFQKYCSDIEHPEYFTTMQDYYTATFKGSDTATLLTQATNVCKKEYFQQQRLKAQGDLMRSGDARGLRMSPSN